MFLLMVICSVAMGQATFGQPSTKPSQQVSVMVFPFRQLGDVSGHAWIGDALHDQLISAISGSTGVKVMNYDTSLGAASPEDALAAARSASPDFMVFGTFQIVDDMLRVNGHIEDTVRQEQVATLQATGHSRDFFNIEDGLAQQLRQTFSSYAGPNYGIQISPGTYNLPTSTTTTRPTGAYAYENQGAAGTDSSYGASTNVYSNNSYYSALSSAYGNDPSDSYYNYYPWGYSSIYPYGGIGFYGGFFEGRRDGFLHNQINEDRHGPFIHRFNTTRSFSGGGRFQGGGGFHGGGHR
jgi:TolB-like protein